MRIGFIVVLLIGLIPDEIQTINLHPVTNGCGSSPWRISVCGGGAIE